MSAVLQFPAPSKRRKRNATSAGARGEMSLESLRDALVTDNLVPLHAGPKVVVDLPDRTPEMAFIYALFHAMPARLCRPVLTSLREMAVRNPHCQSTQKAANLGAAFTLAKMGDR